MKFVALLHIIDAEKNKELRPAHLKYIAELYRQGLVVHAGPFTDGKGGMVVYETKDHAHAQQLAEADPVVAGKARTLELREWNALDLDTL
ncbi:YciI family protein [Fodinisporobacter ferrooxydans]|uniref:YciI family protein n=1 Tax=Fodinisporobacter ferrooxydans TaxID=2901836 RepID=A0ABY4CQD9_9BACL|nr:YciI family protein [Alicyclobacillaceae bacterium MYW30-H2]